MMYGSCYVARLEEEKLPLQPRYGAVRNGADMESLVDEEDSGKIDTPMDADDHELPPLTEQQMLAVCTFGLLFQILSSAKTGTGSITQDTDRFSVGCR